MFDLSKREYNAYLVLNLINKYGSLSRTQLSEITDLRGATITDITKELFEKDLIIEVGSTNSGKGRNQILLQINNKKLCAIGVSIEVSSIEIVLGTLDGSILEMNSINISEHLNSENVINLIIDCLKSILKKFSDKRILGIGIGDPGIVDKKGELSIFSTQLKFWDNIPLKSIVEQSVNLPVRLEVNERLKALGEKKYGLAKNVDDFICLHLGKGIGASILSNGMLVRGYNGTAGEIGHTCMESNKSICICGSYGCLETIASLGSIMSQIKEAVSKGVFTVLGKYKGDVEKISIEDVKYALSIKDKLCVNIVETAGNLIGIALSNVINILNPKLVILEGEMVEFGETLVNSIKSAVFKNSLGLSSYELEFKLSELKELSSPYGAITMIFDEFLMTKYFDKIYLMNLGELNDIRITLF